MSQYQNLLAKTWKRCWSPPERIKPSEWAEKHRILPPSVTAEPGPYSNDRTPYMVGIMDACTEPGVEEVTMVKGVQIGGSEAARNCIGYWIDNDPGPCMLVMPDELSARETIAERIKPLLNESPKLKEHVSSKSWDNKATAIYTDTMPFYGVWAGSPQRLASRPIRYLILDEVDKFPAFSGKESGPIELASERTTTYGHRRFIFKISTPTNRRGNIWRAWEASGDKRRFYLPCPHCGEYQSLDWQQVKFPKRHDVDRLIHADRIETEELAWYECRACEERITDAHKTRMLHAGVWVSEDQAVTKSGRVVGSRPKTKRVGFHISSLYSPWVRFSVLAAEFIRAKGIPAAMMSFRNNKLAEPFEEQAMTSKPELFEKKMKLAGPPNILPDWTSMVLATADVQKDHLYYVIRAWGPADRSQLIAHGIVTDFDDLYRIVFETEMQSSSGVGIVPSVLAIDSKYRTADVNKFCERLPSRIWPAQGSHVADAPPIQERAVKGYEGVIKRTVNPNYWKTALATLINNEDVELWLPHNEISDNYIRQMTAEHLVFDPKSRRYIWDVVSQGADNHLWDCEYHQVWLSQHIGVKAMPTIVSQVKAVKNNRQSTMSARRPKGSNWATKHKGRY